MFLSHREPLGQFISRKAHPYTSLIQVGIEHHKLRAWTIDNKSKVFLGSFSKVMMQSGEAFEVATNLPPTRNMNELCRAQHN